MELPDRVAAVILAAGESRRFGSPKQLAMLDGQTLLQRVTAAARDAQLRPIVAVIPPALAPAEADVTVVGNPQPERGMSHSLRLGFAALPDDVNAAVILLGDQPTVEPGLLARLLAARGTTPFVATRSGGLVMPPVLVERSHFVAVQAAGGDMGLRVMLRESSSLVTSVALAKPLADVDTVADLLAISGG
jgi:CTP:molybdopterin cytidylyltransferase MocA